MMTKSKVSFTDTIFCSNCLAIIKCSNSGAEVEVGCLAEASTVILKRNSSQTQETPSLRHKPLRVKAGTASSSFEDVVLVGSLFCSSVEELLLCSCNSGNSSKAERRSETECILSLSKSTALFSFGMS